MARRAPVKIDDLEPGAKVSGYVHACYNCEALFIASVDSRFCCNACRVAFSRK